MSEQISDSELAKTVEKLIPTVDLDQTSIKNFIKLVSKELGGIGLSDRKSFIKGVITEILDQQESCGKTYSNTTHTTKRKTNNESTTDGLKQENSIELVEGFDLTAVPEPASSDPNVPPVKPVPNGKSGVSQPRLISKSLKSLLHLNSDHLSRPELMKKIWEYIKEEDLQYPKDKRIIILNKEMQKCFGVKSFSSFSMSIFLSCHIYPFEPIGTAVNKIKEKQNEKLKRKALSIKPVKKKKVKREKKQILWPVFRLSNQMAAFMGKEIMSRQHITQALWKYIKEHNLQYENDKRVIKCDTTFQELFNVKTLSMFTLTKAINKHIREEVDKTSYYENLKNDANESNQSDEDNFSDEVSI